MKKRNRIGDAIKKRSENSPDLDSVMYDGNQLGDDFLSELDESGTIARQENEELKARVAELEEQIELHGGVSNALIPYENGQMVYEGITLTPTGLDIPDDVTESALQEIGVILKHLESSIQWHIGDWAKYLSKRFGRSYEDIAQEFGYTVETLWSYASVCDAIGTLIRNQGVSFSHHRLVTKMKPREQRKWLELAAKNGWKVSEMREAISGNRSKNETTTLSQKVAKLAQNMQKNRKKYDEMVADVVSGAGGDDIELLSQILDDEIEYLFKLKQRLDE